MRRPCTGETMTPFVSRIAALLLAAMAAAGPASAQGGFEPRVIVNGSAITGYEVDQRARMLQLFNAQGDLQSEALTALIDDRLRMQAAKDAKITLTDDQLRAGMTEFASRANLDADKFIAALAQGGVAYETFRDFVRAGIVWREVVRQRFAPKTEITSVQVDREIARIEQATNVRLQVGQIVVPIVPGQEPASLARARAIRARILKPQDFAVLARENTAAGFRSALGSVKPEDLPEAARDRIRALQVGQVTQPTVIDGTVRIYQLQGGSETPGAKARGKKVDYAEFLLPGDMTGSAEAAKIRARVDRCDDLNAVAKGLRADRLTRRTVAEGALPRDVAERVSLLDPGESTDFQRGPARVFLMLCARVPDLDPGPQREVVRAQLLNQQLAAAAETYLQKLRSDALIRQP